MTNEEITIKLTKHHEEIGSLKHRVDDIEEIVKAVNELAISVGKLAENVSSTNSRMSRFEESLKNQGERIGEMEKKPSRKWDSMITVIISTLVGGIIAYMLRGVGF